MLKKAKEFMRAWLVEYPKAYSDNSKFLWLFGLRYQLALFMVLMISIVCVIAYWSVSSTISYTFEQKLGDLRDECGATKSEIALLLQQGYAEALAQPADTEGSEIRYTSNHFDSAVIMKAPTENADQHDAWRKYHFDLPAFPKHPQWSRFYWSEPFPLPALSSTGSVPSSKHSLAVSENLANATKPTSEISQAKKPYINLYLPTGRIFRFEVTSKFERQLRMTRVLPLIVNCTSSYQGDSAEMGVSLAMTPSGAPRPEDSPNEIVDEGSSLLATARKAAGAWERQAKSASKKLATPARDREEPEPILFPAGDQDSEPTLTAVDLAGTQLKEFGGKLHYSRGDTIDPAAFAPEQIPEVNRSEFQKQRATFEQRLKDFEVYARQTIDPYAVILAYDDFKQFRMRASSLGSLAQLQRCVEHELGLFETSTSRLRTTPIQSNTDIAWRSPELSRFKLAISKLTFTWPNQETATGATSGQKEEAAVKGLATQDIAYIIRASSLDEIKNSASVSVGKLTGNIILTAIVVAILTFAAATYLTRPLLRMKTIAKEIAELGFAPDGKTEIHIQSLLEQLPTGRRDEVGTLSEQFKETTLQVIRTNKQLRDSKDREMAEQRKNEQAERNKAIADEVSQAVMLLLASVSHDMRQPLNPIFFYAERLLQRPNLGAEEQRSLNKILRSARGLSFLVEDILDYKRILAGDVVLSNETVDVETLLSDLKDDYAQMAEMRGTKIVISNEWRGDLTADGNRLKRVLNNLISNACKATQQGMINLRIVPYGVDHVELSVRDTGSGMDEAMMRLLFEPPERQVELARQYGVRSNNKDPNSTRIGLFVCKQLIEAMGGSIQCTSEVGKGSEFVVRLPLRAPESARPSTQSPVANQQLLLASQREVQKSGKAIVIDDDPRCTEILAQLLNGLGYEVEQILDPQKGLERALASSPDLITLDVYMPGMNGWDVLRSLKAHRNTADTTVIMVTIDPDEEKATLLGANGFVNKPIDPSQFTTAVWQAIRNRQGANVLVVDDDAECRRQLVEILEPSGCRIIEGVDGEDALQKLSALDDEPLDLAIVDLYMPNMDGFTLIDQLRQKTQTKDARIIILSGGVLSESERQKLFRQADQFFSKGSVSFNTLRGEIQNILVQQLQQNNGSNAVTSTRQGAKQ